MKTANLVGKELDASVARAMGLRIQTNGKVMNDDYAIFWYGNDDKPFAPSTDWAQGGPIIERERIGIGFDNDGTLWKPEWKPEPWVAYLVYPDGNSPFVADETARPDGIGPTPLIAAMRAFVAGKFGDEVPDEAAP